jgi:hypothetical protein
LSASSFDELFAPSSAESSGDPFDASTCASLSDWSFTL